MRAVKTHTEEKKYSVCECGFELAACRLLYPRLEGKEKISAFYEEMAESLLLFFREASEARCEEFKKLGRRERKSFPMLRMNMFFSITHEDEEMISIVREYVLCEGKAPIAYRRSGEIWGAESELLLPARRFFPHKLWKKAEKNEFYYDGGAVLVENLFPESTREGKKARLSDYIRETKV
jgi:hypothetical protein